MEIVGCRFVKKLYLISLLGTLGLFAQSPRFSFTVDSIGINTQKEILQTTSFKLFLGTKKFDSQQQAVLGKTVITKNGLWFYPWVPLQRDVQYTAVWEGETKNFSIPREEEYKALEVLAVHPSSTTVPSNLLKWYIQFSRRVNPSKIYDHISLLDASGKEVERAILPLTPPLLSEDGKTLTLWMEPGRQKRDLGPNKHLGAVMQPDRAYTLVIDATLKDENGLNLQMGIQHQFKTTVPDRVSPNAELWNIKLPSRNSKEALHILFGGSLDFGSLDESFAILKQNGEAVEGIFQYGDTSLVFYPNLPWERGTFKLQFNKRIEDLAGNNLERSFDRDVTAAVLTPSLEREFTINP